MSGPAFVVGGCALLILGLVLLIAAVILLFVSRRKRPPVVPAPAADAPTMVIDVPRIGTMEWISGPLAGRKIEIPPGGLTIGREPGAGGIVLDDPRVSKRHLSIGIRDGAVVASDAGSTNGTFRNSFAERVTAIRLDDGDTLIFPEDLARLVYRK
ncbi:MAG TPA: FHA domain-containing protein [Thermoanaerobaculia bacterium]|nr:FHA domain-containing protein [Thermoanaerobaculia bacterium]